MSLTDDYRQLHDLLAKLPRLPAVRAIHLPPLDQDLECRDSFGFLFLEEGSIGIFYANLDNSLQELWARFSEPSACRVPALTLCKRYGCSSLADNALAIGVFNALWQHLLSISRFPVAEPTRTQFPQHPPLTIGIVGYFRRLIVPLLDAGHNVRVLELAPERIETHERLSMAASATDLTNCDRVFVTASTLVNDSLDDIVDVIAPTNGIHLLGPTGSGFPDHLLQRGIDSVGGFRFAEDQDPLPAILADERWGDHGQKYEFRQIDYPVLPQVLTKSGLTANDGDLTGNR